MGETSTCLVRSFSTPADTCCVAQEGNPMRMLGESISFGRFMSENLNWEKWSTFSHKRYVEEAEKYSKPGSVAAKKAYFEAHYKRKAAERATALIQDANAQANGKCDSDTHEGNCTDSFIEINLKEDNIETTNEQLDKYYVNYDVVDCADTNQHKCEVEQSDLKISIVEGAKDVPHPYIDNNLNMESCTLVDNPHQFDHVAVHENIAIPVEERAPDPGNAGEFLALPVKGTEVNSSPKLSTKTRAGKLSHSLDKRKASAVVPPRNGTNNGSKGKKSIGDEVQKKTLTARSLHMSINLPSGTGETSETAAASLQSRNGLNSFSSSKKSVGGLVEKKKITAPSLYSSINLPSGTGVTNKTDTAAVKPKTAAASLQSRNGLHSFSSSKKSVGGLVEKKRITAPSPYSSINLPPGTGVTNKTDTAAVKPRNSASFASKIMKSVGVSVEKRPAARSLHLSINLPSVAGVKSKIASAFEHNRNKKIHSNLPKDHPVVSHASIKASHHLLNQASAKPPSQGRRTERLLNKSVSGGVTANAKLSSASDDCLKSSSTIKSNSRSPTLLSPFRLRSEERAVKRKERMEETRSKAEEKVQLLRTSKAKTEHDQKKLQQSSGSKSKLAEDRPSGSQSPSNQIRKISLTLPKAPKHGRKASSSTIQDKNSRNSWKPPININNSKHITEKVNRTSRQSGTSSSSNITRENASPNIQH